MSLWSTIPLILERATDVIKAVAGLRRDKPPTEPADATAARHGQASGAAAHRASRQKFRLSVGGEKGGDDE